jgi:integrase
VPITPRGRGYLVTVHHPNAPKGRVRKQHNGTTASARLLEQEIWAAFDTYGVWPVPEDAEPIQKQTNAEKYKGTLSQAAQIACATQWNNGKEWGTKAKTLVWGVVQFFEERGKADIDDIMSVDIEAFKTSLFERDLSWRTVNSYLSILSVLGTTALTVDPKLATKSLAIKRAPKQKVLKWWLRPEDFERVLTWLHEEVVDPEFADYISMLVLQGFRPNEGRLLEIDQFVGMDTDEPWITDPGTKTEKSANAVPLFEDTRELAMRCIDRAKRYKRKRLFAFEQRQCIDRWNEVREFLGVSDIPTATLRSLRRTFAYLAHRRNLSTRLIQQILRHETILTTQGYLDVVGGEDGDLARELMNQTSKTPVKKQSTDSGLGEIIAAYREAGAGPKEIAELVKELRE